jgi:hypothetical protein
VVERDDIIPREWDTGAYLDIGAGSWDIPLPHISSLSDQNYNVPSTAVPSLGDNVDGANVSSFSEVNLSYSLPGQLPQSNSALAEHRNETDLLSNGSHQRRLRHFTVPVAGGTGLSTPSPGSSCDDVNSNSRLPEGLSPKDLPYLRNDWHPATEQIDRGLELFFAHVSHFIPFLHRPTLDPACIPAYLVLGILSLAYQYAEDPIAPDRPGSGEKLSLLCFHRARVLAASEEEVEDDQPHNIALVQTLLLLELCAMFYICGKTSTQGLKMHSRMISIARSTGLMRTSSPATAGTKDLDSMWREAIKAESHKRTILAAHQIDALWYQFLSIPRCLSHLEIKHDLPCPENCWNTSTAAEWAHQQLLQSHTRQVQYTEAVRLFLSRSPDVESIPQFDPYGAINIAQFLLSSAREVSGWSTMTGQVSLERFEPLRASLVALAPFICQREDATADSYAATRAATWEMAMIELNIWSPSHTGGIVESSIDGVLSHSTYLAWSSELPFGSDILASIQPHLDWFLRRLDVSDEGDFEAPWLDMYAYKAFLLGWQLVRGGVPGAMHAVGIQDNDAASAISWMRNVFAKKRPSRLRNMIVDCLDVLEK